MANANFNSKKTNGVYFAEVLENPPETHKKFGNDYRSITVVKLTGEPVTFDYKHTRSESALNPGDRVLVKSVSSDKFTWNEAIPFELQDPEYQTFNPDERAKVIEFLEKENKLSKGNVQWMITSDPMVRIKARMNLYNELNGDTKTEILAYTASFLDLYDEIYSQVNDRFANPVYKTDESGNIIYDAYGEPELARQPVSEYGLRDITNKALSQAIKKFNL